MNARTEAAVSVARASDRDLQRIVDRAGILGAGAILLGFVAMLLWAASAPLSGSIVAGGQVKVDTNRKTVQHRDGGIVAEILVREGDEVKKDQPLVVLDDARIDSSYDLVRSQLDAELVRRTRLIAERDFAEVFKLPKELAARALEPRIAESLAREEGMFAARRKALNSQFTHIRQQIADVSEEIAARERQDSSTRGALKLMEDELGANEELLKQNFVNKSRILTLQRAVAEYHMRINENLAEMAQAKQKKSDLESKSATLRENYVQEANAELRDTGNRIVDLEEKLRAATDASQRKIIVAPVAGKVVDLRVTTAGAAIGPRDPLLDIVPKDNPLLIEARVPVDAIGELRPGLHADVHLTAYKQRVTPLVEGRVIYVSADALTDRPSGFPYYVTHIQLSPESLYKAGDLSLHPGMAAEVYIKTRERTALDYLIEPLGNSIRRAFRDY